MVDESLRSESEGPLLAGPEAEDPDANPGYLKILLGYASGVGKFFRMLDEARRRRERGQDVPRRRRAPHAPPPGDALLAKLEVMPLKHVGHSTAIDVATRKTVIGLLGPLPKDLPVSVEQQTLLRGGRTRQSAHTPQFFRSLSKHQD